MTSQGLSYHGYRFPPEIISHAVRLYHRFGLSFRDTEDLLAQRAVTVTYETIRQWCQRFGPVYARRLQRRRGRMGDPWHLGELFVTIQGRQQYLWRDCTRMSMTSPSSTSSCSRDGIGTQPCDSSGNSQNARAVCRGG
jgi:transposase-like protein